MSGGGKRGKKKKGRTTKDPSVVLGGVRGRQTHRPPSKDQHPPPPLWIQMRRLLYFLVLARTATAFLIHTEFVPDEGWQSTEVAYYFTYGRGHLTWEWLVGLRSHIYPLCIAGIYWALKWMGADTPQLLILAPRLFQAFITALGDYAFFLYCHRRFGLRSAKWSLASSLTCWFTLYTGPRTITNSVEMSLNSIAMYLLDTEQMAGFCGIVALNFSIRPTALVIWIPQALVILRQFFPPKVPHRIPKCILTGLGTLVAGALLDWKVFGRPMLAWYRFIKFNFLEGKSAQFGTHHPLWYFYSAIPSILGPNVIILIVSLYSRLHKSDWTVIMSFLFCFSLVGHKEIRFLLPVLPYVFAVMGNMLTLTCDFINEKCVAYEKEEGVNLRRMFRHTLCLCLICHFLAASYFCAFHQGGIRPATEFVNTASRSLSRPEIWVIMPCYSIPVFTYMHNPDAHFEYMTGGPEELELEKYMPNFRRYTTNSTELKELVAEKLTEGIPFPNFLLCFDEITGKLLDVFKELGINYYVCHSQLHAQFGEDRGLVTVLCQKESLEPGQEGLHKSGGVGLEGTL